MLNGIVSLRLIKDYAIDPFVCFFPRLKNASVAAFTMKDKLAAVAVDVIIDVPRSFKSFHDLRQVLRAE